MSCGYIIIEVIISIGKSLLLDQFIVKSAASALPHLS